MSLVLLPVTHINNVRDTEQRLQALVLDDKISWEEYEQRIEKLVRQENDELLIQHDADPQRVKPPLLPCFVLAAMAIGLVCAIIFGSLASNVDYAAHARQLELQRTHQLQLAHREYLQYACSMYRYLPHVPPECK